MSDYTPTTEDVRSAYAIPLSVAESLDPEARDRALEEFDRWLAEHDWQVKAQALEEAADVIEGWAEKTTYARVTEHVLVEVGAPGYLRELARQLKEEA